MTSDGTKIRCSGCNAKLKIPAGQDPGALRCPRCGTRVSTQAAASAAETAAPSDIPTTIGPYRIVRKIAKGGMGVVYEGVGPEGDGPYAVKVMSDNAVEREEWVVRFEREARIAMRIQHPGVVATSAIDRYQGKPYMVMELVDGSDLSQVVKREGALDWQRAVGYALDVAGALERMVELGIVHRDIKPQNIMLTADGHAKLADFGLAKILDERDDDPVSASLTMTGTQMGSPAYMPPEQIEDAARVTPAADVYSLGAALYELCTGQRPFPGKSAVAVMEAVLHEVPPRPRTIISDLPLALDELIMRCLAKLPVARPADGAALKSLLERVRDQPDDVKGLIAAIAGTSGNPKLIALIALVLVVIAAAVATALVLLR